MARTPAGITDPLTDFVFVPGRTGIRGNESEDLLVNLSITDEGQAMNRADIISVITETD